jgi:hypothetical protein
MVVKWTSCGMAGLAFKREAPWIPHGGGIMIVVELAFPRSSVDIALKLAVRHIPKSSMFRMSSLVPLR